MSGETIRLMALWGLRIAACTKSPVCQCSPAASGGIELYCNVCLKATRVAFG